MTASFENGQGKTCETISKFFVRLIAGKNVTNRGCLPLANRR